MLGAAASCGEEEDQLRNRHTLSAVTAVRTKRRSWHVASEKTEPPHALLFCCMWRLKSVAVLYHVMCLAYSGKGMILCIKGSRSSRMSFDSRILRRRDVAAVAHNL